MDTTADERLIKQWVSDNLTAAQAEQRARQMGCSDEVTLIHLKTFKKLQHQKRLSQGTMFMMIGAFVGFISCVLSIINPFPQWYNVILYGLTSVAVLVAFAGLYLIFE